MLMFYWSGPRCRCINCSEESCRLAGTKPEAASGIRKTVRDCSGCLRSDAVQGLTSWGCIWNPCQQSKNWWWNLVISLLEIVFINISSQVGWLTGVEKWFRSRRSKWRTKNLSCCLGFLTSTIRRTSRPLPGLCSRTWLGRNCSSTPSSNGSTRRGSMTEAGHPLRSVQLKR